MQGREEGEQERTIILAHQIEMMARQKQLRGVQHYLPKSAAAAREEGSASVLAMLRRFKERQDGAAS